VLSLRLSGAEAAVLAAQRRLGGQPWDDSAADAFWASLRDQTHGYFGDGGVWRMSVPSHASALVLRGEQLIEWGGAQRWLKVDAAAQVDEAGKVDKVDKAASIRRTVAASGGHATLFRGGDKRAGVFHPLAPAVAGIHARLKQSFDPAGIFNPGRMYAD
jgi:glycolate oxidase FAD binding subunit